MSDIDPKIQQVADDIATLCESNMTQDELIAVFVEALNFEANVLPILGMYKSLGEFLEEVGRDTTKTIYQIVLKDTRTEDTKKLLDVYDDDYSVLWIWTQGNYECDCNRSIFMELDELPCNSTDNVIELVSIYNTKTKQFLDITP